MEDGAAGKGGLKKPGLEFPKQSSNKEKASTSNSAANKAPANEEVKETNPFKAFDKADEQQISLILEGIAIKQPFYEYASDDGKTIYGISYSGVIDLVHEIGNMEVRGNPFPEHTDKEYVYTVTATDIVKNISLSGIGTQLKRIRVDNIFVEDAHARVKALSKAQRNAFRALIPPQRISDYFVKWYQEKNGDVPPPLGKIILVSGSVNLNDFKQ